MWINVDLRRNMFFPSSVVTRHRRPKTLEDSDNPQSFGLRCQEFALPLQQIPRFSRRIQHPTWIVVLNMFKDVPYLCLKVLQVFSVPWKACMTSIWKGIVTPWTSCHDRCVTLTGTSRRWSQFYERSLAAVQPFGCFGDLRIWDYTDYTTFWTQSHVAWGCTTMIYDPRLTWDHWMIFGSGRLGPSQDRSIQSDVCFQEMTWERVKPRESSRWSGNDKDLFCVSAWNDNGRSPKPWATCGRDVMSC